MADHSRMMNFHSSILQVASIIKNNEQKKAEESFEMEKKKRERKANYSREETERLVALILPKKDILENKKNGADQWQEKKQAWEDIERAFNKHSDGTNYRDSKNLRVKYESLKRDIKKKWSNILAKRRNADGKLPKFSAVEKKIKDILPLQMDGFCDFNSMNDKSDDDEDSSDSSTSDSNTKCHNLAVKKERVLSDEEATNFEAKDVSIEYQQLSDGEPPNKKMHEDPLVGKQQLHNKCNEKVDNHDEEKFKEALQIDMLKEELEIKKLQKKIMEEELLHKRTMHELEKQHLLLKIEALKNEKYRAGNAK